MTDFKDVDEALADLQGVLPVIKKNTTGNAGGRATKYADLADICRQLLPLTSERGLAWTTRPTLTWREDGKEAFVLMYSLRHGPSGTSIDGEYPLGTGSPQQLGSAITYARRYCLAAVTGIVADEDDDGTAASTPAARPRGQREKPRPLADLPRNDDGTVSRSRATDEELDASGNMTDEQQRRHNALERDVLGTDSKGKSRNAPGERLDATLEDDPWLQSPPAAVRTPRPAGNPSSTIIRHLARLGYEGDQHRDARLQVTAHLAGREYLTSTNDLTAAEGVDVIAKLSHCRDRAALDQLLEAVPVA